MSVQTEWVTVDGGHRVLLNVNGQRFESPPVEHLLFYAALVALVQVDLVELPVALALGVGHALLDLTRRPGLVAVAEALEEV